MAKDDKPDRLAIEFNKLTTEMTTHGFVAMLFMAIGLTAFAFGKIMGVPGPLAYDPEFDRIVRESQQKTEAVPKQNERKTCANTNEQRMIDSVRQAMQKKPVAQPNKQTISCVPAGRLRF